MSCIAIIAALPGELSPLVRTWSHERRNAVNIWRTRRNDAKWIAACAGMGQQAATRAFGEIEKRSPISRVISVGWAGSLNGDFIAGRAYGVAGVIDTQTGERFPVGNAKSGAPWLVTSPAVAAAEAKFRLAAEYGGGLVDMEAAAVARLAAMRGIPFECFKGVSDGASENLPDFNRFISPQGQLRLSRLLFFVLPRPWYWPGLIRMGENSKKASQSLTGLLLENLLEPGEQTNSNGNSNYSS